MRGNQISPPALPLTEKEKIRKLEDLSRSRSSIPHPLPRSSSPSHIMRIFLDRLFLVLVLFFSPVTAIGTSCFKVVSALVSRPGYLFDKFQSEICDAGCQPTVPHWDLWTRNNTFVPAVRSLVQRMNVPHKEEALLKMGDNVALSIKESCGPMLGGGVHICSDSETLAGFGNCFKRNFLKASIKHLPALIPMASDESCKEQLRFLEGDELWDTTIPQNMRDYAKVCGSLGPYDHDEL
jgi:aarF domain-containing kinase